MNLGYSNRMFNSTQGHDTATKRCSRFCAGELDRRIAEHRKDPGSAISHEEIMRRVKSRR